MRVNFVTNVGKSQLKDKGDGFWIVQGVPMTVDNAVMNGILYPADENAKGLSSYKGKPVVLRHPVDENGNPISALSGNGLLKHYSGGVIVNTYNHNGINYYDAEFNINMMRAQEGGEWYANKIEKGEPIGISTGLYFSGNNESGIAANGARYMAVARNQQGDHVAMLPDDEPPAGGKDTFMRFNGENDDQEIAVNIDHELESMKDKRGIVRKIINKLTGKNSMGFRQLSDKIERKLREINTDDDRYIWPEEVYDELFVYIDTDGIMLEQAYRIVDGEIEFIGSPVKVTKEVKYTRIQNHEGDAMRETLIAALAAKGITVNADITDAELLAKYNEANTPDVSAAINQALQSVTQELASIKQTIAANADKELDALAEKAAPLLGLEKDEAKALGANALHKVLAKNGVVVGAPNATNAQSPVDKSGSTINMEPWKEAK